MTESSGDMVSSSYCIDLPINSIWPLHCGSPGLHCKWKLSQLCIHLALICAFKTRQLQAANLVMCLECHENDNIIHEKTEMQIVYWMFADVQQNIFN